MSWTLERLRESVFREACAIGSERGNVNEGRKHCLLHKHKVGKTLRGHKPADHTLHSSRTHTAMCVRSVYLHVLGFTETTPGA